MDLKYTTISYDKYEEEFRESESGYWIKPDGTLIILDEPMIHGKIAAKDPAILEKYKTSNPEDADIRYSSVDATACICFGWVRISLSQWTGSSLNVNWGNKVTDRQIKILTFIIEQNDPDDENEIWYDGGPGDRQAMFKMMFELAEKVKYEERQTADSR